MSPAPLAILKIADVQPKLTLGTRTPPDVSTELRALAESDNWQVREVAATALVEIGKREPAAVLAIASEWARSVNENVRRAAGEGLRDLVKKSPKDVRGVLEILREDDALYVRKSVASVLRNASRSHPDFVLKLCREWAASTNANTRWIVKEGLRKLAESGSMEARAISERV